VTCQEAEGGNRKGSGREQGGLWACNGPPVGVQWAFNHPFFLLQNLFRYPLSIEEAWLFARPLLAYPSPFPPYEPFLPLSFLIVHRITDSPGLFPPPCSSGLALRGPYRPFPIILLAMAEAFCSAHTCERSEVWVIARMASYSARAAFQSSFSSKMSPRSLCIWTA